MPAMTHSKHSSDSFRTSAISIVFFLIVLVIAYFQVTIMQKREERIQ